MKKLENIVEELELKILSRGHGLKSDVSSGCCCDLLSWVMANGKKDAVWITVQTHVNVIAVASLLDLAGVIIPSNMEVDKKTIEKAQEEGVTILSTHLNAFQLTGMLYNIGIGAEG
ncbi:MAG TPA: AraC family transcriptional regulator [Clostridiales bacterium]|nr:DRTGG domain-containing protein [Clostridia bacterium]HCS74106.1 AraC family transcriptional regulator [Clostridiales bacterium]